MKGIGRQISVGLAREATRGTPETTADFWVPHSDLSIDDRDVRVLREQSYGVIEDSVNEDIVEQFSEITIGAPAGDQSIGLLLLAALGTVSSQANADASGNVYDHTFSVNQNVQHPSLTVLLNDPLGEQDYSHALAAIDTLELAYEAGEYVSVNTSLRSRPGADANHTVSISSENLFLPQNLEFKLAANKAGLGAADAIKIKSARLVIEKNLENDVVLGQLNHEDYLAKNFTITGQIEAIYENETDFKNASVAGTAQAMRLDLTSSQTIGTAANPRLLIDLPLVKLRPITRGFGLDDVVIQTVEFKAFYSTAESEMIDAVLTNTVASY